MSDDFKLMPMLQQNKTFTTEFRGVRYDYYLTGPIGAAEDYLDLCNILRSASAQDEVIIRINCPGGSVNTGNMIINAINESEANVIGFIESECGSMATFIFLACHTWGVSEAAEFFAHTCSYGAWGKEHENFTQAEFLRKQQHKMTRKRYSSFLDDDQIERLLLGQDVYLDADEIMERLNTYAEARDSEGCGDPDCEGCSLEQESMPSIDSIIETAVASGVEQGLAAVLKKYELVERPKKSSRAKNPITERVDKKLNEDLVAAIEAKKPSTKTKKALDDARVIKENMGKLGEQLEGGIVVGYNFKDSE